MIFCICGLTVLGTGTLRAGTSCAGGAVWAEAAPAKAKAAASPNVMRFATSPDFIIEVPPAEISCL
jgi:hypothetical protein